MTLNINAVNLAFPFNLSLPPKTDYANYSLYKQIKEPILNEFMQAFLAQNSDNHLLLSPKSLLSQPTQNPTHLTNPYWQWIVRHDISAYDLELFAPTKATAPLWSMDRMGQSSTLLPDGRVILIGGEFEDGHDPMFWIYNDVIVKHPDGNIEIFGYPRHIFAPTDFHTATLVGDTIWIIGSLGYLEDIDHTQTSIYRLNIHSYKIEKVATRNSIGWLHDHSATLKDNQIIIKGGSIVGDGLPMRENFDEWALNLKTLIWKNLTKKHWQVFMVQRKNGDLLHLDEYKTLIDENNKASDSYQSAFEKIRQDTGKNPDLVVFTQLFSPPIEHDIDESEQDYDTFTIFVDNIKVRYKIDWQYIQVYIEGILPPHKVELIQENLRHTLSKLENHPCEIKQLLF